MKAVVVVLQPDGGSLTDFLPKVCGGEPATVLRGEELALATAKSKFATAYDGICLQVDSEPQAYEIKFKRRGKDENQPELAAQLYEFPCKSGSNNYNVYYTADLEGVRAVAFAWPILDVRYENDRFSGKVKSITVTGYRSIDLLINSSYDAGGKVIVARLKWRDPGDAFSVGTWTFDEGIFTLVKFEVDPTDDGGEKLQTVVDFLSP